MPSRHHATPLPSKPYVHCKRQMTWRQSGCEVGTRFGTAPSGARAKQQAAGVVLRGLSIVTEPVFEETLWRGYLANEVVYEAAATAGNRSPAELKALKKLEPLFQQIDETALHALVESGVPIGPKINVKHLPEELLRALAKHQLATRERMRQDSKQAEKGAREEERLRKKDRREEMELRIKWPTIGATVAGVIVTTVAKYESPLWVGSRHLTWWRPGELPWSDGCSIRSPYPSLFCAFTHGIWLLLRDSKN